MALIIVTGLIGEQPVAGQTCHYLQYVLGFKQLGHDVYYIEDGGAIPYHPVREVTDDDYSYTVPYVRKVMAQFDLAEQWAYMKWDGTYWGIEKTAIDRLYRSADLLVNVSGATWLEDRHFRVPRRAYIDTDPHVTHIKIDSGDRSVIDRVAAHTHYFTFAGNIDNQ